MSQDGLDRGSTGYWGLLFLLLQACVVDFPDSALHRDGGSPQEGAVGDSSGRRDGAAAELTPDSGTLRDGPSDLTLAEAGADSANPAGDGAATDGAAGDATTCPLACTNGCADGTCEVACVGGCTCPAGWPCRVNCRDSTCGAVNCGQATSCEIDCGNTSCGSGVTCGPGPCTVLCSSSSCRGVIDCSPSSGCCVVCAGPASCNDKAGFSLSCPDSCAPLDSCRVSEVAQCSGSRC